MEKKDFYLTINDIKMNTKEYMAGSWIKHAKVTLFWFLLIAVFISASILGFVFLDWYYSILILLLSIFAISLLKYGYDFYCLESIKKEANIKMLFSGIGKNSIKIFLTTIFSIILELIGLVLFIIPGIKNFIKYSVNYFVIADKNNLSATQVLKRSSKLLKSNNLRFFDLFSSFSPLFLVSILTLGIALIWILPYYVMAKAHFYENLKTDF